MNSVLDSGNMTLPVPPTSIGRPLQRRQMSEDGTGLLYKTYNDYFNMEEDITSPARDEISSPLNSSPLKSFPLISPPQHQQPKDDTPKPSTNLGPFFFVLSASSPLTPSTPETGFTPISPTIVGDIPEALSQLLPQPSTSLLEVINGTGSRESPEPEDSDDRSSSAVALDYVPEPRSSSTRSRPLLKLGQLHLRDSTAARLISQAFVEPSNPPTSAVAEVAPVLPSPSLQAQPRRRPNPVHVQDPDTRFTYTSPSTPSTAFMKPRTRGARSMDMSSLTPRQPPAAHGHTRGLSSPFPLPIRFIFAPSSVPGSATTTYSYF